MPHQGEHENAAKTIRLVAVDPGKTDGVAVATSIDGGESFSFYTFCVEHSPDRKTTKELLHIVRGALIVICEDFIVDHRAPHLMGDRMYSSEQIGFWRALCTLEGTPFVLQSRNWKWPRGKKSRTKILHFTGGVPKTQHERDALSHLVVYMQRHSERFPYIEEMTKKYLQEQRSGVD